MPWFRYTAAHRYLTYRERLRVAWHIMRGHRLHFGITVYSETDHVIFDTSELRVGSRDA